MKRCSTLVIREMKFKTTVRDHFTVISRANIKEKRRKAGSSVGEAVGGNNWNSHRLLLVQVDQAGKQLSSLLKWNTHWPRRLTIAVPVIYPWEIKPCPQNNVHRNVHDNIHNNPKPETIQIANNRWLLFQQLWYIHTKK